MKCVQKCQKIAGCWECAVYGSRPPIASKPGSSPLERPGLDNSTSQAWADAIYPHTIVFGTLSCPFLLKECDNVEVSTIRGGTRAGCVRPWLTLDSMILFRPCCSSEDEPCFEAIGGREPQTAHCFQMGSAVKWVFCALFDTMSIVKLFHSFENRKILPNNSSWRCSLYRNTIFKSWLQLLSASILQLPNKSHSFRLCHSANKKLLNVYVPHLSINSDSRNLYYK